MVKILEDLQKLNEVSDKTNVLKILQSLENQLNNSHGNNYTAAINDDNKSIQYGDITNSHNPYNLSIDTERITKFIIHDNGNKSIETYNIDDAIKYAFDIINDNLKYNSQ